MQFLEDLKKPVFKFQNTPNLNLRREEETLPNNEAQLGTVWARETGDKRRRQEN